MVKLLRGDNSRVVASSPPARPPSVWSRVPPWLRRHPYLTVFALALGARLVTAGVVAAFMDGSVFLDDQSYLEIARAKADGSTGAWDDYTHFLYERTATLLVPLTVIFRVVGSSSFAGQAFVALFGSATAVLVARLASSAFGRPAALVAGTLVALLPSQVLFSSLVLKDALVWSMLALLAVLVHRALHARGRELLLLGLAAAAALFLLGHLRLHTQIVAGWALILTALFLSTKGRLQRTGGALLIVLIVLVVPWLSGAGPAGVTFVSSYADQIPAIRSAATTGGSAIGGAATTGGSAIGGGARGGAHLSYLPSGLKALLIEPVPWSSGGTAGLRLARAETLLWYPILALGVVGLRSAWSRRDTLFYPLAVGGGSLVMWGLVEGNVGTAYRHRGEFVWAVCLLASGGLLGIARLVAERLGRAPAGTGADGETAGTAREPRVTTSTARRGGATA